MFGKLIKRPKKAATKIVRPRHMTYVKDLDNLAEAVARNIVLKYVDVGLEKVEHVLETGDTSEIEPEKLKIFEGEHEIDCPIKMPYQGMFRLLLWGSIEDNGFAVTSLAIDYQKETSIATFLLQRKPSRI